MRMTALMLASACLLGCVSQAYAGSSRVTLVIKVHSTKSTGTAWDPLGGAPEIAVKTIDMSGSFSRWHSRSGEPQPTLMSASFCRDSFSCRLENVVVPPGAQFRLEVWDQDTGPDPDHIGNAVCTSPLPYLQVTCTVNGRLKSILAKGES